MKKLVFVMVLMMAALVINAQTRVAVKVADLPKAITENVARDYIGFTIKEAIKVTANNVVSYEVVIVKGTTTETLVYDKDGKFVRKVTQKTGTTGKKDVAPVKNQAPTKK